MTTENITTTTKPTLADVLTAVSVIRRDLMKVTGRMEFIIEEVRLSEDYIDMEAQRVILASMLESAEAQAKDLAIEQFKETGVKTMLGVTVKEFSTARAVYQATQAQEWAAKTAPQMLKLDVRAFEKYALAVKDTVSPLSFVTFEETTEFKAQLDRDLSGFVK